jgi:ornithine carbamoyltransferase
MHPRHFLNLREVDGDVLRLIVDKAVEFKRHFEKGDAAGPAGRFLDGRYVSLLFEWPATRTRLHFETATRDLGGTVIAFFAHDMPISRGETIGDTARVLSRHSDIIMLRTSDHERLKEMAAHSESPVINGCTAFSHPFRILVEIMTYEENRGPIAGKTCVFLGDCKMNQARSWIHGAVKFGCSLRMACPPEFAPDSEEIKWARAQGADVSVVHDARAATEGADYVCTDIWVPLGQSNKEERRKVLGPYQVNSRLMALAKPDAIFMHPLAASRGDEVTNEVIDGPQSVVWTGGIENKRHLLKALFMWQLGKM